MASDCASIRRSFAKNLKAMRSKNSLVAACAIILGHISVAVIVAMCALYLFHFALMIALPSYVLAIFLIGSRYRALANIVHECTHYAFTLNRELNNKIGKVLSIPLFSCFEAYRHAHLTHHTFTGDYERDLDFHDFRQFRFHEKINRKTVLRHLYLTLTLQHVPSYIGRIFYVKEEAWGYNLLRGLYISTLCTPLIVFGPLSYPSLVVIGIVLLPFATALQIITYWSDALDHGGLFENSDPLFQTRNSIVSNPVLRLMMFPRNDCYHLIHHLFPHVPVSDLPACHSELMKDSTYASLEHKLSKRTAALWLRSTTSAGSQEA